MILARIGQLDGRRAVVQDHDEAPFTEIQHSDGRIFLTIGA